MNDNLLSPNDIDFATRCTEGADMPNFNSQEAIFAAGILSGPAGAAAGPMHLFGDQMAIADKPDF